jgi:undecaprenyl-diphosphatase
MQLNPAIPAAGVELDTSLVPGLRLPKIPGLPGPSTPGLQLGDLVGPPAVGSIAAKADMTVVKGAQLLRTTAGDEWARRMDREGVTKLWFDLAARHRASTGRVQGWLDTALLATSMAATAAVTAVGKQRFGRPRPFVVDPSITVPLEHRPKPNTSYPSGHASAAFAGARVIARLAPELAAEAYSLATQVAVSRVYAGVHFPSDVVAGALLGTGVAETALRTAGRGAASVAPALALA